MMWVVQVGVISLREDELSITHTSGAEPVVRHTSRATATWLRAACGSEGAFDLSDSHIMSDSPGLLRFIRRRQSDTKVAGVQQGSGDGTAPTRSWLHKDPAVTRLAREAALDALSVAASSSTLFVAPQHAFIDDYYCKETLPTCHCALGTDKFGTVRDPSRATRPHLHWSSFYRPLLTRSFCIEHVGIGVPECPTYAEVFLRDATSKFALGPLAARAMRQLRKKHGGAVPEGFINASNVRPLLAPHRQRACQWELLRPHLSPRNPCKTLPGLAECSALFASGLK